MILSQKYVQNLVQSESIHRTLHSESLFLLHFAWSSVILKLYIEILWKTSTKSVIQ